MKRNRKWMKLDSSLSRMARHPAPLFLRPRRSDEPYGAFVRINPRSRRIDAVIDSRGSRSAALDRSRGNVVLIPVPPTITGEALLAFCRSHSIQALMRRVCDGWNLTVDACGNYHGAPDDVAADAYVALLQRAKRDLRPLASTNQFSFDWSAPESASAEDDNLHDTCADARLWLGAASLRDLWPDEVPFQTVADRLFDEAVGEGVRFEYGREAIEDALADLAAVQLHDRPETLSAHQVRDLVRARHITAEEVKTWSAETFRTI